MRKIKHTEKSSEELSFENEIKKIKEALYTSVMEFEKHKDEYPYSHLQDLFVQLQAQLLVFGYQYYKEHFLSQTRTHPVQDVENKIEGYKKLAKSVKAKPETPNFNKKIKTRTLEGLKQKIAILEKLKLTSFHRKTKQDDTQDPKWLTEVVEEDCEAFQKRLRLPFSQWIGKFPIDAGLHVRKTALVAALDPFAFEKKNYNFLNKESKNFQWLKNFHINLNKQVQNEDKMITEEIGELLESQIHLKITSEESRLIDFTYAHNSPEDFVNAISHTKPKKTKGKAWEIWKENKRKKWLRWLHNSHNWEKVTKLKAKSLEKVKKIWKRNDIFLYADDPTNPFALRTLNESGRLVGKAIGDIDSLFKTRHGELLSPENMNDILPYANRWWNKLSQSERDEHVSDWRKLKNKSPDKSSKIIKKWISEKFEDTRKWWAIDNSINEQQDLLKKYKTLHNNREISTFENNLCNFIDSTTEGDRKKLQLLRKIIENDIAASSATNGIAQLYLTKQSDPIIGPELQRILSREMSRLTLRVAKAERDALINELSQEIDLGETRKEKLKSLYELKKEVENYLDEQDKFPGKKIKNDKAGRILRQENYHEIFTILKTKIEETISRKKRTGNNSDQTAIVSKAQRFGATIPNTFSDNSTASTANFFKKEKQSREQKALEKEFDEIKFANTNQPEDFSITNFITLISSTTNFYFNAGDNKKSLDLTSKLNQLLEDFTIGLKTKSSTMQQSDAPPSASYKSLLDEHNTFIGLKPNQFIPEKLSSAQYKGITSQVKKTLKQKQTAAREERKKLESKRKEMKSAIEEGVFNEVKDSYLKNEALAERMGSLEQFISNPEKKLLIKAFNLNEQKALRNRAKKAAKNTRKKIEKSNMTITVWNTSEQKFLNQRSPDKIIPKKQKNFPLKIPFTM